VRVCAGENRSSFIFHWTCRFAYICLAQRRKIALVLISFARRRFILYPTHSTENGEYPTIFAHTSHLLLLAAIRPPVTPRIRTAPPHRAQDLDWRNRHTPYCCTIGFRNDTNTNNFIELGRESQSFYIRLAKAVIRFGITGQPYLNRNGEIFKLNIRENIFIFSDSCIEYIFNKSISLARRFGDRRLETLQSSWITMIF